MAIYKASILNLRNDGFINAIAPTDPDVLCEKVTNKIIEELKKLPSDETGYSLDSVWEELCAQEQGEHFLGYNYYIDTIYQIADTVYDGITDEEYFSIALQSDEYIREIIERYGPKPPRSDENGCCYGGTYYDTYEAAEDEYLNTVFRFLIFRSDNADILDPTVENVLNSAASYENSRIYAFNNYCDPYECYPVSDDEFNAYNEGYKTYKRYRRAVQGRNISFDLDDAIEEFDKHDIEYNAETENGVDVLYVYDVYDGKTKKILADLSNRENYILEFAEDGYESTDYKSVWKITDKTTLPVKEDISTAAPVQPVEVQPEQAPQLPESALTKDSDKVENKSSFAATESNTTNNSRSAEELEYTPVWNDLYRSPKTDRDSRRSSKTKDIGRGCAIFALIFGIILLLLFCLATCRPFSHYNSSSPGYHSSSSSGSSSVDPDANLVQQEYPASGSILYESGASRPCPLKVITPSSSTAYYIKLVDSDGNKVFSTFIQPGESIEVDVPAGTYCLRYATGRKWYGETDLFGSKTQYAEAIEPFYFYGDSSGYHGYTVELYKQPDGNLNEKSLSKEQF